VLLLLVWLLLLLLAWCLKACPELQLPHWYRAER
jgi:hypothetical protein